MGLFSKYFEKRGLFSKYFEKNTPGAASGGALRAPPRPEEGVFFKIFGKQTPFFKILGKKAHPYFSK